MEQNLEIIHTSVTSTSTTAWKLLDQLQENQPSTLVLRGEVDLEVVRVVMDIQKAAALIEFWDARAEERKICFTSLRSWMN